MPTASNAAAVGFTAGVFSAALATEQTLHVATLHAGSLWICWRFARWLCETYEDRLDGELGGDGPYLIGIRRTARVDVYSYSSKSFAEAAFARGGGARRRIMVHRRDKTMRDLDTAGINGLTSDVLIRAALVMAKYGGQAGDVDDLVKQLCEGEANGTFE